MIEHFTAAGEEINDTVGHKALRKLMRTPSYMEAMSLFVLKEEVLKKYEP